VFLFVANGVPPYIEETISPCTALNEEGSEVETGTVLGNDEVDGFGFAVTDGAKRVGVKVWELEGMGNVERVVNIDVAVGDLGEVVEDVRLEGVGGLHYESIEVKPPEPLGRH
jgi:hypothetical protein